MRLFLLGCLLCLCNVLYGQAQNAVPARPAASSINHNDAKGKPHGMWLIQQPERMGEDAYTEFGTYDHGIKYGTWYRLDNEGQIQSIEHFRNGVRDGEVKYFEKGQLTCIGHYRGLNPAYAFDTVLIVDPISGVESLKAIPSDRGSLRHGLWRFYDPQTGRLLREEEYQIDELIASNEFGLSKADSTYYQQKVQALPHNRKTNYTPSRARQIHYTTY